MFSYHEKALQAISGCTIEKNEQISSVMFLLSNPFAAPVIANTPNDLLPSVLRGLIFSQNLIVGIGGGGNNGDNSLKEQAEIALNRCNNNNNNANNNLSNNNNNATTVVPISPIASKNAIIITSNSYNNNNGISNNNNNSNSNSLPSSKHVSINHSNTNMHEYLSSDYDDGSNPSLPSSPATPGEEFLSAHGGSLPKNSSQTSLTKLMGKSPNIKSSVRRNHSSSSLGHLSKNVSSSSLTKMVRNSSNTSLSSQEFANQMQAMDINGNNNNNNNNTNNIINNNNNNIEGGDEDAVDINVKASKTTRSRTPCDVVKHGTDWAIGDSIILPSKAISISKIQCCDMIVHIIMLGQDRPCVLRAEMQNLRSAVRNKAWVDEGDVVHIATPRKSNVGLYASFDIEFLMFLKSKDLHFQSNVSTRGALMDMTYVKNWSTVLFNELKPKVLALQQLNHNNSNNNNNTISNNNNNQQVMKPESTTTPIADNNQFELFIQQQKALQQQQQQQHLENYLAEQQKQYELRNQWIQQQQQQQQQQHHHYHHHQQQQQQQQQQLLQQYDDDDVLLDPQQQQQDQQQYQQNQQNFQSNPLDDDQLLQHSLDFADMLFYNTGDEHLQQELQKLE